MCGRCGCKALYDLIMDIGGEINALKFSIYCKGQNEKTFLSPYLLIWKHMRIYGRRRLYLIGSAIMRKHYELYVRQVAYEEKDFDSGVGVGNSFFKCNNRDGG